MITRRRSSIFRWCALVLGPLLMSSTPALARGGGNPGQAAVMVLAGPLVLLVWLAALAVVYVVAAAIRRQEPLVALLHSSVAEAGRGRVIFTLWGLLAELLLISAGLVLTKFPKGGLLVAAVLLTALCLAGLGAAVFAVHAGRRLHAEMDGGEIAPLSALGLGLRLLFAVSALPVVGWIVVILGAAFGAGAALTSASRGNVD